MTENKFLMYNDGNSNINIEVFFEDETIWITQKQMSELFNVEINTINYHLKEIFLSKELEKNSTIRKIRIVQQEGKRKVKRETNFYNLDIIIS